MMVSIDSTQNYVIANRPTNSALLLAVSPEDSTLIWMEAFESSPPLRAQWFTTPAGSSGHYHLHTRSENTTSSMELLSDGTTGVDVQMNLTNDQNNQFWKFDHLSSPDDEGYPYRLSNARAGSDMYLDTSGDVVHMARGNSAGQQWKLQPVQDYYPSTSTTSATKSAANPTATAATHPSVDSGNSGPLIGPIAGITVGAVLALVIAALSLSLYKFFERKKAERMSQNGTSLNHITVS